MLNSDIVFRSYDNVYRGGYFFRGHSVVEGVSQLKKLKTVTVVIHNIEIDELSRIGQSICSIRKYSYSSRPRGKIVVLSYIKPKSGVLKRPMLQRITDESHSSVCDTQIIIIVICHYSNFYRLVIIFAVVQCRQVSAGVAERGRTTVERASPSSSTSDGHIPMLRLGPRLLRSFLST